jgi:hypothetical protein
MIFHTTEHRDYFKFLAFKPKRIERERFSVTIERFSPGGDSKKDGI